MKWWSSSYFRPYQWVIKKLRLGFLLEIHRILLLAFLEVRSDIHFQIFLRNLHQYYDFSRQIEVSIYWPFWLLVLCKICLHVDLPRLILGLLQHLYSPFSRDPVSTSCITPFHIWVLSGDPYSPMWASCHLSLTSFMLTWTILEVRGGDIES